MARRILPADTALFPASQPPLQTSVRTEFRGGFLQWLQERWSSALGLRAEEVLFDWRDRTALMNEIAFVNQVGTRLDEAAVKIAPSMLRIVLTVKANLPHGKAQRAFLAEHLDWELRRISELCIVADSFALLDPAGRADGAREIQRYGWSNALKLAYVRDPTARREIWERARGERPRASYRDVLEEIQRFRERKLLAPPPLVEEIGQRLLAAKQRFAALDALTAELATPDSYREALQQVNNAQRELGRLKRVLKERMQSAEIEALAANA